MQYLQLAAIPVGHPNDNTIILAEKATLDELAVLLQPAEMTYLRQAADKGVDSFFFPQADRSAHVRTLQNSEP